MTVVVGNAGLLIALLVSVTGVLLSFFARVRKSSTGVAVMETTIGIQAASMTVAFCTLIYAYIVSDFSVMNVALNSHTEKPFLYKLVGAWSNHEGSMILWPWLLSLYSAVFAWCRPTSTAEFRVRVLGTQSLISIGFLLYVILTSNPFIFLEPTPTEGLGLNPLLQDPGLAYHPPVLYFGYAGFSLAFSFAVAALIEGKLSNHWAQELRPWCLIAWSFLILGLTGGSWWAYYELGWGGWWSWDPVENAGLMPWLLATALIHTLRVVEKINALKNWAVCLAIMTFGLCLVGTFLVRSGVLSSIHTFALDPARGVFILALITAVIGGGLFLFALRASKISGPSLQTLLSREGVLVVNNLILCLLTAVIFLGTLYPLGLEVLKNEQISVGAPYFNQVVVPMSIPFALVMGAAPYLAWRKGRLNKATRQLLFAFTLSAGSAIGLWLWVDTGVILPIALLSLAAWLAGSTLLYWGTHVRRSGKRTPFSVHGLTCAHMGVAVAMAGMTVDATWQKEKMEILSPGSSLHLENGYDLKLQGVQQMHGANYKAERAQFLLSKGGAPVSEMAPEKRYYPVRNLLTTKTALHTRWFSDIYAVLGEYRGENRWLSRASFRPLVSWIWLGGLLITLGGIISIAGSAVTRRRQG